MSWRGVPQGSNVAASRPDPGRRRRPPRGQEPVQFRAAIRGPSSVGIGVRRPWANQAWTACRLTPARAAASLTLTRLEPNSGSSMLALPCRRVSGGIGVWGQVEWPGRTDIGVDVGVCRGGCTAGDDPRGGCRRLVAELSGRVSPGRRTGRPGGERRPRRWPRRRAAARRPDPGGAGSSRRGRGWRGGVHPFQGAEVRDGIARAMLDAVAELGRWRPSGKPTPPPPDGRVRSGPARGPSDTYIVAVHNVRSPAALRGRRGRARRVRSCRHDRRLRPWRRPPPRPRQAGPRRRALPARPGGRGGGDDRAVVRSRKPYAADELAHWRAALARVRRELSGSRGTVRRLRRSGSSSHAGRGLPQVVPLRERPHVGAAHPDARLAARPGPSAARRAGARDRSSPAPSRSHAEPRRDLGDRHPLRVVRVHHHDRPVSRRHATDSHDP